MHQYPENICTIVYKYLDVWYNLIKRLIFLLYFQHYDRQHPHSLFIRVSLTKFEVNSKNGSPLNANLLLKLFIQRMESKNKKYNGKI